MDIDMPDGQDPMNSAHAEDEQALREMLSNVMEAPLLPLTKGIQALEHTPGLLVEIRDKLKVIAGTAEDIKKNSGQLITKIDDTGDATVKGAEALAGKIDAITESFATLSHASSAQAREIANLLTSLNAGINASTASLIRLETTLLAALDAHTSRISAQMARQTKLFNILLAVCLIGIIALSARLFLWPLAK